MNIDELLAQMTLEEKVGQLHLLHGAVNADRQAIREGRVTGFLLGPPRWEQGASFSWAEETNTLQRIAVEESRLGIPLIFSRDVIHGHRTVFPIPLGQAASFNPALVEECARISAREASAQGIRWNYSPMIDICRDPRWGRQAEGYGEDPFLCAQMAEAVVHGYQGRSLSDPESVAACAKHFVGYGAAQGGRDYDSAELSERTLRETYLPPFLAAVRAGAASIMPAIHDLNGTPMAVHPLLQQVLRAEWSFSGLMVSDWGTIADLLKHRVAADEETAVLMALQAGIEMDMVSGLFAKHLGRLAEAGDAPFELIDSAVRRVLTLKESLGLFEHPYTDPAREKSVLLAPEHRAAAKRMAAEGVVLLENRSGVLPLSRSIGSVAVVGPLAESRAELLGTWTLDGRADDTASLVEGVRRLVPKKTRLIADGVFPEAALAQAQEADAIILAVGEHPTRSGEAASVTNIELPPGQVELAAQLAQFGIPLIAVIFAGRALAIEPIRRIADAVLYCFHPGTEGAAAIADVLFGEINPSGRLPVTLPRATGQIPVYYGRRTTGRPARPDARYSTKPIDLPHSPLYPFGAGRSYTSFAYGGLTLSAERIEADEVLIVSAAVTNTGTRPGCETAQCYLRDEVRSTAPPEWELKGFSRLVLAPGETAEVSFRIGKRELCCWESGGTWMAEAGCFVVRIGPDSTAGVAASFVLTADACIKTLG